MEKIFTVAQAAKTMDGVVLHCDGEAQIASTSTDTRIIQPGALFIALRGDRFDGHQFIETAVTQGAVCCVVDKNAVVKEGLPVIVVEDTLAALRNFAAAYRRKFSVPVIGITGSVGKTSTKEMIASVLKQRYNTHMTQGNFNNEIGLPLTTFALTKEHEIMVLEMGMSDFGEIARLTNIAVPDTAVITNIGVSHIEHLGSREGIKKAKLEILEGLQMDGTVILNGDDDMLWGVGGELEFETLYYGIQNEGCDLCAHEIHTYSDSSEFICHIDGKTYPFVIGVPGKHHVYNALAAILVGLRYGVSMEDIQKGVRLFQPTGLRQTVIELPDYQVIQDCYNASPASMQSGLSVLALRPTKGRRVACLGDMLELGDIAETAHRQVGKLVVESGVNCLITVGPHAKLIAEGAKSVGMNPTEIYTFDDTESLCKCVVQLLKKDDVMLVKGSRGMHLEKVVETLKSIK